MNKLTDIEYEELKEQVRNGKRYLYEQEHKLSLVERNKWTNYFFSLSREFIAQTILRGVFEKKKEDVSPNRILGETPDEYVYRMRVKLGFEKPKKGVKEDTQPHPVVESDQLSL